MKKTLYIVLLLCISLNGGDYNDIRHKPARPLMGYVVDGTTPADLNYLETYIGAHFVAMSTLLDTTKRRRLAFGDLDQVLGNLHPDSTAGDTSFIEPGWIEMPMNFADTLLNKKLVQGKSNIVIDAPSSYTLNYTVTDTSGFGGEYGAFYFEDKKNIVISGGKYVQDMQIRAPGSHLFYFNGCSNITIKDLVIDVQTAAAYHDQGTTPLMFIDCDTIKIENVYILNNCSNAGINIYGCKDWQIDNCTITTRQGVPYLESYTCITIGSASIFGKDGTSGGKVTNCYLWGGTHSIIDIENSTINANVDEYDIHDIVIDNCTLIDTTGSISGLHIYGGRIRDITASNLFIYGAKRGVYVEKASADGYVKDIKYHNVKARYGDYGAWIRGGNNIDFNYCVFDSNQVDGIKIDWSADRTDTVRVWNTRANKNGRNGLWNEGNTSATDDNQYIYVANSEFNYNSNIGLALTRTDVARVLGNTTAHNGTYGISFASVDTLFASDNMLWGNATNNNIYKTACSDTSFIDNWEGAAPIINADLLEGASLDDIRDEISDSIGTVSGGLWTESGSNIYYDSGNVGIGAAPAGGEALDVIGNVQATGTIESGAYLKATDGFALADSTGDFNIMFNYTEAAEDYYTIGNSRFNCIIKGGDASNAIYIDDGETTITKLSVSTALSLNTGLSGDWDAGPWEIRSRTFESDVATGVSPFTVASTTQVNNLNVQYLSGKTAGSFLYEDGSNALTADWDAGAYEIRSRTFESDVATGVAPLVVASTTKVSNLNADDVDGESASDFVAVAGTRALTGDWDAGNYDIRAPKFTGRTGAAVYFSDSLDRGLYVANGGGIMHGTSLGAPSLGFDCRQASSSTYNGTSLGVSDGGDNWMYLYSNVGGNSGIFWDDDVDLRFGVETAIGTGLNEIALLEKDGDFIVDGSFGNSAQQTITLAAGATTFAVTTNVVQVTGDGGGNSIETITGAKVGLYTFIFVDSNVTIVNNDAHDAYTVDYVTSADFTSSDDRTLLLVFDGTSWYSVAAGTN